MQVSVGDTPHLKIIHRLPTFLVLGLSLSLSSSSSSSSSTSASSSAASFSGSSAASASSSMGSSTVSVWHIVGKKQCHFIRHWAQLRQREVWVGGPVSSNHLASPDVDGKVDELGVFLDEVLNGLQLEIVRGLLFQDQSAIRKRWG